MGTLYRGDAVPDAIYRGATAVDAVYRGAEKVWPAVVAPPSDPNTFVFDPPLAMTLDASGNGNHPGASHGKFQGRPLIFWKVDTPGREFFTSRVVGDRMILREAGTPDVTIEFTANWATSFGGYIYYDADLAAGDQRLAIEQREWLLTSISLVDPPDALDDAIIALNPTHYWRLDGGAPFADYGSDPVPLTIDTDMGILTRQTVAGALTGVSMPLDSSLRGVGCTPDPNVNGESYLFFTDVNDTTAFEVAANVIGNSNMRLRSQYSTGVSQYPNWRITGTNRNPASLAATGVPAMYAARNSGSGAGRVFSEVEYPTGGGSSGSQGTHPHAGADLLLTSMGATGSVSVARVAVFAAVLDDLDLGTIFDAYTNL